uniref:Uncharacterized protein n=1 Tax=Lactuca sativa TaxID=4236 RepID=A0A9R1UYX2_LACSA|nr:hypothetical protein LSAT_V11C700372450 [Lactuca sativa]
MAEILEDEMVKYLPYVVPLAFSSCNLDDGFADKIDDSDEDEDPNGFSAVSSDDESQDEPRVQRINIRTGVLDEKAATTQALGVLAFHTKSAYESFFLNVDTLTAAHVCLQCHDDGESQTKQILDKFIYHYCESLVGFLYMYKLVELTMALLWQNSVCQKVKSNIDIEDDDHIHEHSEMLMDAITDLLPAFSKAMGSDFAPFFEPLFDPLMDFM